MNYTAWDEQPMGYVPACGPFDGHPMDGFLLGL